jgi:hypothetical protein
MADIDAVPTSLLLQHIDNGLAVMTSAHELNLFWFFVQNDTTNTISRLLLPCGFERPANMTALYVVYSHQLIVESIPVRCSEVAQRATLQLVDVLSSEGA